MMIVTASTTCDPVTVSATANTAVTMEASVHVAVHVLKYQLD